MTIEGRHRQLRELAAQALAEGANRADLIADLLCATRQVSSPGRRELGDAEEIAAVWADLDTYARPATWPAGAASG